MYALKLGRDAALRRLGRFACLFGAVHHVGGRCAAVDEALCLASGVCS